MLRKSVVILTMLLSSMATQVFALGLGTVSVESSLNQPLRVRIEILQLGDTLLQDVVVSIASTDDFERFNIERFPFLTNIRFSIDSTPQGNYVTLTTNQIVREPYLSFILDSRWPNGRLLSEHTILLDLPVFQDQQVEEVRTPISPVLQSPGDSQQAPTQPFVDQTPDISAPVTAPVTPPAPSVAPIIEPEIIDDQSPAPAVEEQQPALDPEPIIEEIEPPPTELADESQATDPVIESPEPEEVPVEEVAEVVEEIAEEPFEEETVEDVVEEVAEGEPQVAQEVPAEEVAEEEVLEEAVAEVVDAEPAEPETITTSDADTLSDIALRVRPDTSVSIQQTMLALQELNPGAFVDGNINQMRSGQVLRVPSLDEIQVIDAREAIDEVNRQNQQVADVQPLAPPAQADPAEEDEPYGQLSVVTSEPDAIDASSGAEGLDDEENAELDRRIAELENQLALRQEEADRARIELEDLDSRLADLESQIDAAQEIIRLQDLQLAQLQDELAEAAALAAEEAALLAAQAELEAEIAAETPATSQGGLMDDVMRILTGNTLMMIFGLVLAVLLLVVLLLRRNKSAVADDEDLDELAESEFPASSESEEEADGSAEDAAAEFAEGDLDTELDEIIGIIGKDEDEPGTAGNIIAQADELIASEQLDEAAALLNNELSEAPDNHDARIKLLEILAAQKDSTSFETHAEIIGAEMSPVLDRQVDSLRKSFQDDETQEEDRTDEEDLLEAEEETEEPVKAPPKESDEAASFLDDLGIDLDTFDDDFDIDNASEEKAEEKAAEKATPESAEEDSADFAEPDDVDMTFDLGGGDDGAAEESDSNDEQIDAEVSLDDLEVDEPEDTPAVAEDEAAELEDLDFDTGDGEEIPELAGGDSKDAEDLEIDSLEFDAGTEVADAEDLPGQEGTEDKEPEAGEKEEEADDENALDFEFDKEEIKEGEESSEETRAEDIETFDFDLDETAEVKAEEETTEEDDDFDFDLDDEAEESAEPEVIEDEEDDLDDLGFLSEDEEVEIESVGEAEEVDMLSDDEETATKLELAYAYQKMGDVAGAKEILEEVIKEGSDEQVKEAEGLLTSLDKSAE